MKISRKLLSAAIACGLLFSGPGLQAGVPVADGPSLANSIANHIETIAQWGQEAGQWAKDNAHYVDEMQAYQKQYEDLRSGNYTGLITKLMDTYGIQGGSLTGMIFGQYSDNSSGNKYLNSDDACVGVAGSENSVNVRACRSARNMQDQTLSDMKDLMTQAENRTTQINALLAASQRTNISAGELQQKAIEMQGLQALLQNDLAKLQLTLEMHKQRRELYQQEQADSAAAILKGNGKPLDLGSVLSSLDNGFGIN